MKMRRFFALILLIDLTMGLAPPVLHDNAASRPTPFTGVTAEHGAVAAWAIPTESVLPGWWVAASPVPAGLPSKDHAHQHSPRV